MILLRFASAQQLSIGDKVEDISDIIRKAAVIGDVDLSGKAIIIDFWETYCGVCVQKMPKLEEIQQQFNEDLQIIYVSTEEKQHVANFLSKRKELSNLKIPIITKDTSLVKLFPHTIIPHVVWIGKDGVLKAVTSSEQMETSNIERLVDDGRIMSPLKKDILKFNFSEPLSIKSNPISPLVQASSLLKGVEGLPSQSGYRTENGVRIYAINYSTEALYRVAYRFDLLIPVNEYGTRIIWESNNKRMADEDRKSNSVVSNKYCYEFMSAIDDKSEETIKAAFRLMQRDLDRLFSVKTTIERRTVKYFSIFKGIGSVFFVPDSLTDWVELKGMTMGQIVNYLNAHYKPLLSIKAKMSETGSDILPTVYLRKNYSSWKQLKKDLYKNNLMANKKQERVDVLVINPNNN